MPTNSGTITPVWALTKIPRILAPNLSKGLWEDVGVLPTGHEALGLRLGYSEIVEFPRLFTSLDLARIPEPKPNTLRSMPERCLPCARKICAKGSALGSAPSRGGRKFRECLPDVLLSHARRERLSNAFERAAINSIHRSSRLWRGCSQTRTVEGGNLPSNFPGNFSGEQSEKRLNGCIAAREIN
jgi:hypothetical protein